MFITVQDFTGVYAEQPFMRELREKSAKSADIHWLDCTKIVGTDCYCDDDAVKAINEMIDNAESGCVSENRGNSGNVPTIHFFDNGNYHYMSKLWTDRIQHPFTLIVFDHHPDMQPPRFGGILSCGGWVLEVLENNKFIQNVVIIGVKDELVETVREEFSQAGDTEILNKVTFVKESELGKDIPLSSFVNQRSGLSSNIYLSIDKDALAPAFAATNWDQGSLTLDALKNYITSFTANHKILGIDICGERAHDFEGDANHTVQKADCLNNSLNRELVDFLQKL
ncbi:MAG: arginase family protein [Fibrobacter sp.]|nr:arginase family protein [Fibrobacter sp.]